jgi:hypothetical protein
VPPVVAIIAYRPHPGQEAALAAAVADHVPILRAAGLATDREPVIARAKDGTVVEVFEWASEQAVTLAHADEVVRALWERFEAVCEYVPLRELPETAGLFASFTAADAKP